MDSQQPKPGHPHGHADTQVGFAEAYCPSCETSYTTELDLCPNDGARLVQFVDDKDALTGRILDNRFEIRERLGEGGMGTVYRALQTSVGRDVAIKVIHARLSRERATVKRFLREAKLSSRLSQMNTVVVHDFGQSPDGMLYLVMELLQGRTLRAVVAGSGGLPLSRVKRIGIQLSDALHAAADLGIVHRDLKPSNIIILDRPAGRDRVKVLDFGLAKSLTADGPSTEITKSGALMGTPLYMAPEVIAGEEATPQSDLYALGCILYEMVTGSPPFVSTSMSALFGMHLTEIPAPLRLTEDPDLEELILALLAKLPRDRPTNAADVHARLGGETVVHPTNTPARTPRDKTDSSFSGAPTLPAATVPDVAPTQHARRRRWLAGAAVIALACGGLFAWQRAGSSSTDTAAGPPTVPAPQDSPGAALDASAASPRATATDDAGVAPRAAAATTDAAAAQPSPATTRAHRDTSGQVRRRRGPTRGTSRATPRPKTTAPTAVTRTAPPVANPTTNPTPTPKKSTTPPKLDFVD